MKQFVANRSGAVPTLDVVNETKVKIYTNEAAIDTDLANLEVGQIVGTAEQTIPDQQVVTDWMDAYMATHYPSVDVWTDITSDFTITGQSWPTHTDHIYYNAATKQLKVLTKRTDAASGAGAAHGIIIEYTGTNTDITFDDTKTVISGSNIYPAGATAQAGFESMPQFVSSTKIALTAWNRNSSATWPVNTTQCWLITL